MIGTRQPLFAGLLLVACSTVLKAQAAATDAFPARLAIDGNDAGGAAVVRVRGECMAISASHVLAPLGQVPATAAELRLADGRHAQVVLRRPIRGLDTVLLTFQDPHDDFCGDELSLVGLEEALRNNTGSIEVSRERGQHDAIAVRIDGIFDNDSLSLLAESPKLEAGISGSPVFIGGRFVGIIQASGDDLRHGRAIRINAIASGAQDIIPLPRIETKQHSEMPRATLDQYLELGGLREDLTLIAAAPEVARPTIAAALAASRRALSSTKESKKSYKFLGSIKQTNQPILQYNQRPITGVYYRHNNAINGNKRIEYYSQIDQYYIGNGQTVLGASGYGVGADYDADQLTGLFAGKFFRGSYQVGCYFWFVEASQPLSTTGFQYIPKSPNPSDAAGGSGWGNIAPNSPVGGVSSAGSTGFQYMPKSLNPPGALGGSTYGNITPNQPVGNYGLENWLTPSKNYNETGRACGRWQESGKFSGGLVAFSGDGWLTSFAGEFSRYPDATDLQSIAAKTKIVPPRNSVGAFFQFGLVKGKPNLNRFGYIGTSGDNGWEGYVAVVDTEASPGLVAVERYVGGKWVEALRLTP